MLNKESITVTVTLGYRKDTKNTAYIFRLPDDPQEHLIPCQGKLYYGLLVLHNGDTFRDKDGSLWQIIGAQPEFSYRFFRWADRLIAVPKLLCSCLVCLNTRKHSVKPATKIWRGYEVGNYFVSDAPPTLLNRRKIMLPKELKITNCGNGSYQGAFESPVLA